MPSYTQVSPADTTAGGQPIKGIANAHSKQGGLVVNVQALPWLAWEAGAGRINATHDEASIVTNAKTNGKEGQMRWAFYTNLQLTVADNHLQIVPEFSFSDFGGYLKKGSDEGGGKLYSYGLKLELDI